MSRICISIALLGFISFFALAMSGDYDVFLITRLLTSSLVEILTNEKVNRVLSSIANLIAVLGAVVGLVVAFPKAIAWFNKRRHPEKPENVLRQTNITRLRQQYLLPFGGSWTWIDRGATTPSLLHDVKRIVIRGFGGSGKTREALELIARSLGDLFPHEGVFELNDKVIKQAASSRQLIEKLTQEFDFSHHQRMCLFIDDLPKHYAVTHWLERVTAIWNWLESQCRDSYLIVTVREDHVEKTIHEPCLESLGLHRLGLPELDSKQQRRILHNGLKTIPELQNVTINFQEAFLRQNDGRPQQIVTGLRLWRDSAERVKTPDDSEAISLEASQRGWDGIWKNLEKQNPRLPAHTLRQTLCVFYGAGITANATLVEFITLRQWQQTKSIFWAGWSSRKLRSLRAAAISIGLIVIDNNYQFEDAAVETVCAGADHERILAKLLLHNSPMLVWVLGWLGIKQAWGEASFEIAYRLGTIGDDTNLALQLYSRAIDVDPEDFASLNNRGKIYSELQRYDEALADYGEAIRINPGWSLPFRNRGGVYDKLNFKDGALHDLTEAIRLDPGDAQAFNDRGVVFAHPPTL